MSDDMIDNPFVAHLLESVGPRFAEAAFSSFLVPPGDRAALATAMTWAKDFAPSGKGLFLVGPTGTGKTHLAVAALLGLSARYIQCSYVDVPGRLDRMKARIDSGQGSGSVKVGFTRAEAVLLDELGVIKPSEWVYEQMYLLVDHLNRKGVPVLATSNLDYPELTSRIGERAVSRLIQMTVKVPVPGDDYRVLQARGEV